MLIALGATVVLALVWFAMLRPKSDETTPVTPVEQSQDGTSLTDRPNDAQSAVDSANSANSANEQKATTTGSDSQTGSQSQSGAGSSSKSTEQKAQAPGAKVQEPAKSSDPSAAIIASAKKGNTQVILFWDPSGSDDQQVRRAVNDVASRNGTVKIHAIHIKDVGKYTALTQDVKISTSPTIVILSAKLDAWRITGYTDTYEINGLVGAIARRAD